MLECSALFDRVYSFFLKHPKLRLWIVAAIVMFVLLYLQSRGWLKYATAY